MSGHSKWSTIKHSKGVQDAKRSSLFSKLSKDIIVAVQIGGSGDPNFNPILRLAIAKAKSANMTNDKIEHAVNKGMGNSSSDEIIYYKTYEAYGPSGVAILIDCQTDNPNRTIGEIKTIINKNGGKMLSEGSISWQFKETGYIKISVKKDELEGIQEKEKYIEENLILSMLEIDRIEDIKPILIDDVHYIEIYCSRQMLKQTHGELQARFNGKIDIEEANIIKIAQNLVNISNEEKERVEEFIDKIKECEDVDNVWDNMAN